MYTTPLLFPNKEGGEESVSHGLTSLSLPKIRDCDVRTEGGWEGPGPCWPACNITSSTSCQRGERCSSALSLYNRDITTRSSSCRPLNGRMPAVPVFRQIVRPAWPSPSFLLIIYTTSEGRSGTLPSGEKENTPS